MAFEVGAEAAALHFGGRGDAGVVEERRREIDVQHHVAVDGVGADGAGVAHEEGHAQGFLVHQALVEPAVIAEEEALVGGVDDDGVVGQAFGVEVIEQPADVVVDALDAAQVVLDVDLVGPLAQGVALEVGREVALEVGLEHVLADLHGDGGDAAGASFVVIVEVVGLGDVSVVEEVLDIWRPGSQGRCGALWWHMAKNGLFWSRCLSQSSVKSAIRSVQ